MKEKSKSLLCALIIVASGIAGLAKNESKKNSNTKEEYAIVETRETKKAISTPIPTDKPIVVESEYTFEGEKLFKEVNSKMNISNWNSNIALNIVELLNGHYPTSLLNMSEENANIEIDKTSNALTQIIRNNLNPNTPSDRMVDLSNYTSIFDAKFYLSDSLRLTKKFTTEVTAKHKVGEATWQTGESYRKTGEDLLNYEIETTNDAKFLQMPAGCRLALQTIFNEANQYMPEEAYVDRPESEYEVREHRWYWLYFQNNLEKCAYIPRRIGNNKIIFERTDRHCNVLESYTKEEMYALGGKSSFEEQRRIGISAKYEIWEMGMQIEVENRIRDAIKDIHNMSTQLNRSSKVKVK